MSQLLLTSSAAFTIAFRLLLAVVGLVLFACDTELVTNFTTASTLPTSPTLTACATTLARLVAAFFFGAHQIALIVSSHAVCPRSVTARRISCGSKSYPSSSS